MNLAELPILINIKQASQILGVHPDTLRKWDNQGRLKAVRLGSRQDRRWHREEILRVLSEGLK